MAAISPERHEASPNSAIARRYLFSAGVSLSKRTPKKLPPAYKLYICSGCGYEYDKELGDDEGGIYPGTPYDQIPEEWICPVCGDEKNQFIEV